MSNYYFKECDKQIYIYLVYQNSFFKLLLGAIVLKKFITNLLHN